MNIETLRDLLDLRDAIERHGLSIPENLIIVSKQVVEESKEYIGIDKNVINDESYGIRIYGIRVVRDMAEVV